METIRSNAIACGLTIINGYDIVSPPPPGTEPVMPPYDAPEREHSIYRADHYEYEQSKLRIEDFEGLKLRVQEVRDDLEEWVRKHLSNVQADPPPSFVKFVGDQWNELVEKPWQLLPDLADRSFAIRAAHRQDKLTAKVTDLSEAMRTPGAAQVRPQIDATLQAAIEAKQEARSAASLSSKVGTGATAVGGLLLAYDVATAESPSEKAVAGIAGMVGGAKVAEWLSGAIVRRTGSALLGAGFGGPVGTIAAIAITEGVAWSYRQLPLEYRERVDATLWHWPYYIGLGW